MGREAEEIIIQVTPSFVSFGNYPIQMGSKDMGGGTTDASLPWA